MRYLHYGYLEVAFMLYESGVLSFQQGTYATDTLLTFLLGLGIVFVGLVALVAIVKIMGAVMGRVGSRAPEHIPEPVRPAPHVEKHATEPNHGELIAAVSAALATVMGKQVNGIRILSMKKVD